MVQEETSFAVIAECRRPIRVVSTFRELWAEHVMWTRLFTISTVSELADLQQTTRRLLRNPKDFARELRRYYGDRRAERFDELLSEHLTIAAKLLNDLKAGRRREVEADRRDWQRNADDLADFLGSINSRWSRERWRSMLREHLRMVENEFNYRLNGNYADDVRNTDEMLDQAMEMADYMAQGIIRQFQL